MLWLANLGVLSILGYIVADIFIGDRPHDPAPTTARPTATRPVDQVELPITPDDGSAIVKRNIFGLVGTPDATAQSAAAAAPLTKTKLQLKLLGTVAGDVSVARAIIEDMPSKVQDLYKIGDFIQGARIDSIERNRVILSLGGQREVLDLCLAASERPANTPITREPAAARTDLRGAVKVISPTEFEINKKAFLARVGGMQAIFRMAQFMPHVVNGKTEGLRIGGLEDVSMARFVGLENNDVIQVVNGQQLTSRQKAFQVFRKARGQPSMSVQLLRDGKRKTLSFAVE